MAKHEPFVAKFEQGQREHNFAFIEANLAKLEAIIGELQERNAEIARLAYRARVVRDRHG